MGISIVVDTIAAAEDVVYTSLTILYVGRGFGRIGVVNLSLGKVTDATVKIGIGQSLDLTAQVVAAIDVVANPGEAASIVVGTTVHCLSAHIGLGMSQNVGITGAGKGVEHATVAQVDLCIAGDGT